MSDKQLAPLDDKDRYILELEEKLFQYEIMACIHQGGLPLAIKYAEAQISEGTKNKKRAETVLPKLCQALDDNLTEIERLKKEGDWLQRMMFNRF